MNRTLRFGSILLLLVAFVLISSAKFPDPVVAQSGEILWAPTFNISNSPDQASTNPNLLLDPSGVVHLFWAEKVSVSASRTPDTVMYSQWDGSTWMQPMDIFFAPASDGNMVIDFPQAVMDQQGLIHLIWLSQPNFPYYTLFYSSVPAPQARYVQAWQPKQALAEDLTGTEFSTHIAYEPPSTLHVAYARGVASGETSEERGVNYIRSTDGGLTWSEPVSLFKISNLKWGASNVRVLPAEDGRLFISWTVWDESGNGHAVYFIRSLDGGVSFDAPVMLAQAHENDYERDWNSLIVLPDKRLMAMWEGGFRAYRQGMYSSDDGATWTEPVDLFPKLIGENGFVKFAVDGANTLHLFYAQRIREGESGSRTGTVEGLWHSTWDDRTGWRDPAMVGGINPMVNPQAVIARGNRVVTVWYSTTDGEIITMTGKILDAPEIPAQPWPESLKVLPNPPGAETASIETELPQATVEAAGPAAGPASFAVSPPPDRLDQAWIVYLGALPALAVLLFFLAARKLKRGRD